MSADRSAARAGGPPKARLFFALWPTPAAAAALVDAARNVAEELGGRLTRPETVHLTLAFLGEVDIGRMEEIREAACAVGVPPFEIELDRLELWSRQRLLVARCDGPPALDDLVARLRAALAASGLLPARSDFPFKAHVTLARKLALDGKLPAGAGNIVHAADSQSPQPVLLPLAAPQRWHCDRFVLARSRLSPSGSDYEAVAEFPLAG